MVKQSRPQGFDKPLGSTNLEVFCYGEIGVDNIIQVAHLPAPELAAFPSGDSYHIGGAAANTAIWLAQFGVSVGLSGNQIGADAYGQLLIERLQQKPGLDLRYVEQSAAAVTPFCRALVTPDGERSFLIFGYPQSIKVPLRVEMLQGARYLALDLYGGEERLQAARLARAAGVQTAVGDVIGLDHPVLPLTSIATNSAAYVRSALPGVDARQHARQLQAVSRGVIVMTDGPDEVFVVDVDGAAFTVQPPTVEPLDATGAGDAFRSGLLSGLLRGENLPASVRWGAAAGALKVQHLGAATEVPTLDEVIGLAATLQVLPA